MVGVPVAVRAVPPTITKGAGGGVAPLDVEITAAGADSVLVFSTGATASAEPSCERYTNNTLADTGLTASAGQSPPNVVSVSLAALGATTVKAVACPGDPNQLDPSDVLLAQVQVALPAVVGVGAVVPANVSATLALGGVSAAEMSMASTQGKLRRALARSLQRDGSWRGG
jgi:hypothetical protein